MNVATWQGHQSLRSPRKYTGLCVELLNPRGGDKADVKIAFVSALYEDGCEVFYQICTMYLSLV